MKFLNGVAHIALMLPTHGVRLTGKKRILGKHVTFVEALRDV